MTNPYAYGKSQHQRTEQPRQYKNYRSYKSILRREFKHRCVYCCAPDGDRPASYAVEHYLPKKHFPLLVCTYDNLFYSCASCNTRKGEFWPKRAELKAGRFIPNPCDHVMFQHLRFNGVAVEARTEAGRLAVEMLDLNSPQAKQHRSNVLTALELLQARIGSFLKARIRIELKRKEGLISDEDYRSAQDKIGEQLACLANSTAMLAGR